MAEQSMDGYETLLADVAALYETVRGPGAGERNRQTVLTYWDMGHRIVADLQGGEDQAGYGDQVIRQLSSDMTERYGSGFSVRTMFDIRKFAVVYEREAIPERLCWEHFRSLLAVKDEARRAELERLAVTEELNTNALRSLARSASPENGGRQKHLVPRTARMGLYKVVVKRFGGGKRVLLDCGFYVKREIPLRGIRNPEDGTYVERQGKAGAYRFTRVDCEPGERYCYPAAVLEVVDGDTVNVRLDLGFDTFVDQRLRLRGVDAPEIMLEAGKKARAFVTRRIRPGDKVTVLTYGHDVHGRFVGDILFGKKGRFLNQEILDSPLARPLDTDG